MIINVNGQCLFDWCIIVTHLFLVICSKQNVVVTTCFASKNICVDVFCLTKQPIVQSDLKLAKLVLKFNGLIFFGSSNQSVDGI